MSFFRKNVCRSLFAISAATSLAASAVAGGPHPKFARDLDYARNNAGQVPVIVQYKNVPDAGAEGRLSNLGAVVNGRIHQLGIAATVPSTALDTIENDSNVAHISLDHAVGARSGKDSAMPAPISTSPEFTLEPINTLQVWSQGYLGANIGVAVIDSGINPDDDFANRIVYNQSFVPGQLNVVSDPFGHGTHVAGLIAGNGADSVGNKYFRSFIGIAPQARLINLRVLDGNGAGSDSTVIAAIEKAIALKNTYNIRIINLSLGRPIFETYTLDPLCQEVEKAWKAGIVVVVAAGNNGRNLALNTEGYGTVEAPGNDPYVLTVGAVRTMSTAVNTDDAMASYSSKGPSFIDQVSNLTSLLRVIW